MNTYIQKGISFRHIIGIFIFLYIQLGVYAQSPDKITLVKNQITVIDALKAVEKQTGKSIGFSDSQLKDKKSLSLNLKNVSLDTALNQILKGSGFTYQMKDNYVMIVEQKPEVAKEKHKVKKISGQIADRNGEPLIGVNVAAENNSIGTITDIDGRFTLDVPENSTLTISYVGYQTQHIRVATAKDFNVVMSEDSKMIDEVVVTALGIKRSEKALSYNVQKVGNDELVRVKDANFVNSLSGKVAGVNIQRSASGVGGATRVIMRGSKSIAGDNNVLYVVDGVPMGNQADRDGDGTGFGGASSGEGIASFNPEDIESLSVLTGPSAAALYGAAAANGVILINTKKGAEGKLSVNVSSSVETMKPLILPKLQHVYGTTPNSYTSWGKEMEHPNAFDVKDFFQTGMTYNNSVNLSVGNDKNQTYFSVAGVNSDGIVPNNKYHRYNVMLRNTAKFLKDKLVFDASAGYVREFNNNQVAYGTYFNPIVGVYLYPRGYDFDQDRYFERFNSELGYYEQSWSPGDFGMNIQNPYWIAYRNIRPEVKDRFMFFGSLTYHVTDYLNAAVRARLDNTYTEKEDKRYATTYGTFAKPKGRYTYSNSEFRQKYLDFMVNFNRDLASRFHLMANAGASYEEYDTKGRGYGGQLLNYPNVFTYGNIDPTTGVPSQTGGDSRRSNFAFFGSAELSMDSKLFLTLTGRGDKPSQLVNSKEEWIYYPSVGLSAILTDYLSDDWRNKVRPVLGYLKVRGSYTEVGSPIPFTGLTPGTQTHKIVGGTAQPFEYYPLSDLKAEKTKSYEFGIDSHWFNNHISLAVTLYHSNTYNQLLQAELGGTSGYKYMFVQAGNIRNKGIELTLGYNMNSDGFNYATNFTATANRNKIIRLASDVKNPITQQDIDLSQIVRGRFRLIEGGELGDVYANQLIKRDTEGYVDYTPGDALQLETTKTPLKLGSVNAKWNLGWSNSFTYKGVDFNFLVSARLGGIVISKTQAYLNKYGVSEESAIARKAGGIKLSESLMIDPKAYYEAVSELDAYNAYSATNVRLQEMSLGYTFPNKWFGNVLKGLKLTVYGSNLLMLYNKAPYDPEMTASTGIFGQGYDYFMLPSQRTIGASLKFSF